MHNLNEWFLLHKFSVGIKCRIVIAIVASYAFSIFTYAKDVSNLITILFIGGNSFA